MNPTQNDNYFVWAVEQSVLCVVAVALLLFLLLQHGSMTTQWDNMQMFRVTGCCNQIKSLELFADVSILELRSTD